MIDFECPVCGKSGELDEDTDMPIACGNDECPNLHLNGEEEEEYKELSFEHEDVVSFVDREDV